ncbi:MAG: phosphotransferase family protein [Oscillochloridaceae bacterium umkhey_bin13]
MLFAEAHIDAMIAHALPGERLLAAEALGERTLRLELRGGRRLVLRLPASADPGAGDPLAAEAAALTALRGEIDLPLPELRSYQPDGPTGEPFLLTSYLEGMNLIEALPLMDEDQRYALGRALGDLLARVHSYTNPVYGALDPQAPPLPPRGLTPNDEIAAASDEDVRYLRARLDAALSEALSTNELDPEAAEAISAWAAGNLAGTGQPARLTHGDLRPERILVRRRERGWMLSGVVGWGNALAWSPAWDHVGLLEQFNGDPYFSLRVGYGNAYDATTERRYDQVRAFALAPYRLILFLEAGRPDLALSLIRSA